MIEEEIFEINDFSTSSEWERFIADLEEILIEWNLTNNINKDQSSTIDEFKIDSDSKSPTQSTSKLFSNSERWQYKTELIAFGKVSFKLDYFCFKKDSSDRNKIPTNKSIKSDLNSAWQDMNAIENDWSVSGHPLVRYYGLSQFLVLSPLNGETISTEDRARHLIGSAAIALHNIDCEVPFFCQISSLSRQLFMGVGHISNSFRTYFEMIQFSEVPTSYRYFNELMVLFKKKLYSSFSYNTNVMTKEEELPRSNDAISKVQISIRFTYILTKWPTEYLLFNEHHKSLLEEKFSYFNHLLEIDKIRKPVINLTNLSSDPLTQMQLATTWPSVAEELITDNAYHSDLQPMSAPRWTLRVLFLDQEQSNLYCQNVEMLRIFSDLQIQQKVQLLNYLPQNNENDDYNVRSALDRLSSPSPPINLSSTTSQLISSVSNLVLSESDYQVPIEYIEKMVQSIFKTESISLIDHEQLKQFKSSPFDSLSWRISNLCLNFYGQTKQISTLAQIWKCFLNQLRDYWQVGRLIPYLDCDGKIDYGFCIFHQKLQMLNCCIVQKIKQEHYPETKFEEDSDEEFFDAEEQLDQLTQAEGQLYPLKDSQGQVVYLLSKPGKQIQVPLTQDPAPMTEDMLSKQVTFLSQIEDPKTKIRLQSACLLSDMEAFKAANPDCQFEDFIRWHSPRDWIETTNNVHDKSEFGLSKRMKESTTWKELWEMAHPCPVRRQKRLFNYTKEAEEILQYFQSITMEDLVQLLNPIIVKSVIQQLFNYRKEILSFIKENLDYTLNDQIFELDMSLIEQLFAQADYKSLFQPLLNLEYNIVKFYSIFIKFSYSYETFQGKPFSEFLKSSNKDDLSSTTTMTEKTKESKKHLNRLKAINKKSMEAKFTLEDFLRFILDLLNEPEVEFANTNFLTQIIMQIYSDSDRFQYEQSTSVGDRLTLSSNADDNDESMKHLINKFKLTLPAPTGKEFIIRARSIQRPAPYSRPSSQRMYCFLSKDFRIATAFTEDTAYF